MAQFVKYELPNEGYDKVRDVLQKVVKTGGKIKAGVNEVTKMVERGNATLVIMAEDVSPEELLLHMPVLCKDKKIPYTYMKERKALGEAAGIRVKASCIAVIKEGAAKKELEDLIKMIKELSK
jgi:ribosomal protein L7Ae-like RNA K-turn-binding protein